MGSVNPPDCVICHSYCRLTLELLQSEIFDSAHQIRSANRGGKTCVQKEVTQKYAGRNANQKKDIVEFRTARYRHTLMNDNKLQSWKCNIVFLYFPFWLAFMETLRNMTGSHEGFLKLVSTSLLGGGKAPSVALEGMVVPVEPSFPVEGALWFPDLLAPDPYHALSIILCATEFATLNSGISAFAAPHRVQEATDKAKRINKRFRIAKVALACAVAPATFQFPSALMLFWISSSLCKRGWGLLIHRLMPLRWDPVTTNLHLPPSPKKQQFRGPTMKDVRGQGKKKKPSK